MEQRASLLIVDDERGPAESLRMIFKPSYNVFLATGGEQALDIVRQNPIDVVTLDLRMPQMSGVEVLEKIKQFDPDIEVIIVTGYSSMDSALYGLRCGAFDYISKPFDVPQIAELVQRALARRQARLRGRRTKEDFLANLSHELRTPLSAIIGYGSILADELQEVVNPEQRTALGRIQANAVDLLGLIEGVLLLNAIDAGDLDADLRTFNVAELVQRVVHQYGEPAREKQLSIHLATPASSTLVTNDEAKVERVLCAILDNAIKFTHPGGTLTLAIHPGSREGSIDIEVRDTGMGMDAEELRLALEGLTQGDASARRRFRGLGIGMRLATQLIRLIGGELRVASALNHGTNVTISVPSWNPPVRASLH